MFGLVAAEEINATADCPSGVAIIETEQSFLNGLVGLLTIGIYTPQTVTITCAGGGGAPSDATGFTIPADASPVEAEAAAQRAFELAMRSHDPVVLRYLR